MENVKTLWRKYNDLPPLPLPVKRVLILAVVMGTLIPVIKYCRYAYYETPLPVYLLDKLNLRTFYLPNMLCKKCNNFTYEYIIENANVCGNDDVFLFVGVMSYHPHVQARQDIRKTWGGNHTYKNMKVKTLFFFGYHEDKNLNNQLQVEQEEYFDIVQARFVDNYYTLTNKSVMILQWVMSNCKQAKFILKTDDDSFNIPQRYLDYLMPLTRRRFVGGYCFTVVPDRRQGSKFYVTPDRYPDVYYPTYCAGPGYVMSHDAVQAILSVSEDVLFLPMEDVFITGVCRQVLGIRYTDIPGMVEDQRTMTKCNLVTWMKNSHNVVPPQSLMLWSKVKDANKSTDCIFQHLKSYAFMSLFLLQWLYILYRLKYKTKHFEQ